MVLQIIRGSAAATLIAAGAARADDASCRGFAAFSANPSLTAGHIASREPCVHLVKDGPTQPGCPNQTPACTERAYLVSGDRVIVSGRRDAFACVTYVNAKGSDATLPVDKGGEFDCQVWMPRLGPWLIVDDNTNCGGLNVTFRGVYRRKP